MDLQEAYEVLGIAIGTPEAEVRAAYKDLVAVWHPDRFHNNVRLRQKAEAKLKQLNIAFQTIESAGFPKQPSHAGSQPASEDTEPVSRPSETTPPKRRTRLAWLCSTIILLIVCLLFCAQHRGKRTDHRQPASSWDYIGKPQDVPTPVLEPRLPTATADTTTHTESVVPRMPVNPIAPIVQHDERLDPGPSELPSGCFSIGSTEDEVRCAQGVPTRVSGATWGYKYSSVEFGPDGRVVAYSNISDNLKVRVLPSSRVHRSNHFTIGSTQDEVLSIQGTPTRMSGDTLGYEYSSVEFGPDSRVTGYSDISHNLKVSMPPHGKARKSGSFSIGSTKDDVLVVQGTPTHVSSGTWGYDYSSVEFGSDGTVVSYSNISNNLRVR